MFFDYHKNLYIAEQFNQLLLMSNLKILSLKLHAEETIKL